MSSSKTPDDQIPRPPAAPPPPLSARPSCDTPAAATPPRSSSRRPARYGLRRTGRFSPRSAAPSGPSSSSTRKSRKGQQLHARAKQLLEERGYDVKASYPVRDPSRLPEIVEGLVTRGEPLVVVGGGDGTISSIVDFLAYRNVALGLLPLGTANSFARSLGSPSTSSVLSTSSSRALWRMSSSGRSTTTCGPTPPRSASRRRSAGHARTASSGCSDGSATSSLPRRPSSPQAFRVPADRMTGGRWRSRRSTYSSPTARSMAASSSPRKPTWRAASSWCASSRAVRPASLLSAWLRIMLRLQGPARTGSRSSMPARCQSTRLPAQYVSIDGEVVTQHADQGPSRARRAAGHGRSGSSPNGAEPQTSMRPSLAAITAACVLLCAPSFLRALRV